jgi:predicted type IV restriction endonuclease
MEKAAKKPIVAFIRELKTSRKMLSFDEASTKQAVVLRLLSLLGWDIFDVEEVAPDYSGRRRHGLLRIEHRREAYSCCST